MEIENERGKRENKHAPNRLLAIEREERERVEGENCAQGEKRRKGAHVHTNNKTEKEERELRRLAATKGSD